MLRVGLIGCGYVAQRHLAGWKAQPNAQVVAVADLNLAKAQAMAQRFGIDHAYSTLTSLLENHSLDAIDICTRPDSHEELVLQSLEKGLAVCCQKPVAENADSLKRMIDAGSCAQVPMMVHENWRWRPWYREMSKILKSGDLGQPVRLRLSSHDFRCLAPGGLEDQPYFASMRHFILYEMGPHLIDTARFLLGKPTEVLALGNQIASVAGEDAVHVLVRFEQGRLAILDMNWSTADEPNDRREWGFNYSVLEATKATLRTSRDGQLEYCHPDGTRKKCVVPLKNDVRLQIYQDVIEHFCQGVISGKGFETDFVDQQETMACVWAAYRSMTSGQFERVDETTTA